MRSIYQGGNLVGSIVAFPMGANREIAYGIDPSLWGNGIATRALDLFLQEERTRPLHAHVAHDNLGSIRVLERAGFTCIGHEHNFANARQQVIKEYIYCLD